MDKETYYITIDSDLSDNETICYNIPTNSEINNRAIDFIDSEYPGEVEIPRKSINNGMINSIPNH